MKYDRDVYDRIITNGTKEEKDEKTGWRAIRKLIFEAVERLEKHENEEDNHDGHRRDAAPSTRRKSNGKPKGDQEGTAQTRVQIGVQIIFHISFMHFEPRNQKRAVQPAPRIQLTGPGPGFPGVLQGLRISPNHRANGSLYGQGRRPGYYTFVTST